MKVLLLGSNGMLGQSLKKRLTHDTHIRLYTLAHNNADFNMDVLAEFELEKIFATLKPDVCINAIAIVNLRYCEENKAVAYMVNSDLCRRLAKLAKKHGTYYVQVSTDHYYRGDGRRTHKEQEKVYICNEYARTKLQGEIFAQYCDNSLILRTNIVGFRGLEGRPTFLEWVIASLKNNAPMVLFEDFYTSSISTVMFADILHRLLQLRPTGLYNLASSTVASKEEFVLAVSEKFFHTVPQYKTGSVASLRNPERADSLGLDTTAISQIMGYAMPDMEMVIDSLNREYMERF